MLTIVRPSAYQLLTTSRVILIFPFMETVFDPLKFYDELKATEVSAGLASDSPFTISAHPLIFHLPLLRSL